MTHVTLSKVTLPVTSVQEEVKLEYSFEPGHVELSTKKKPSQNQK